MSRLNAMVIRILIVGLLFSGCLTTQSSCATRTIVQSSNESKIEKDLYAGVEIGSTGVKAVVLKHVDAGEDFDLEMQFENENNTTIVSAKSSDSESVKDTLNAVRQFHQEFVKRGVPSEHMYFVASSGVAEKLPSEIKDFLSKSVLESVNHQLNFLTVQRESELTIDALIPPKAIRRAILLDVGSGNTKGGYRQFGIREEFGGQYKTFGIKSGTKTFAQQVVEASKDGSRFTMKASFLRRSLIEAQLQEQIERTPAFQNRTRIYLSGGIAWAMTTLLHPEDRRAFVPLSQGDINEFYVRVVRNRNTPQSLFEVNLRKVPIAERKKVEREVVKVSETFNVDQLIAGAEILRGLSNQFRLVTPNKRKKNKQIFFARYGKVAWLLGYVNSEIRKNVQENVSDKTES
jgi:hypothetical protein